MLYARKSFFYQVIEVSWDIALAWHLVALLLQICYEIKNHLHQLYAQVVDYHVSPHGLEPWTR